jgi:hypothetical protein
MADKQHHIENSQISEDFRNKLIFNHLITKYKVKKQIFENNAEYSQRESIKAHSNKSSSDSIN